MDIKKENFESFMNALVSEYEKISIRMSFYQNMLKDIKENKEEIQKSKGKEEYTMEYSEALAAFTAYQTAAESYSRIISTAKIFFDYEPIYDKAVIVRPDNKINDKEEPELEF